MTKEEIIKKIQDAGVTVKTSLSKDELQGILNKIETSETGTTGTVKPDPLPDPGIDPLKDKKETPTELTEEEDLFKKIHDAQSPEEKKPIDRPLIEGKKTRRKKGESSPDSFRFQGYLLLLIVDTIFPFALSFINNLFDKKMKIQPTDLKLSQSDWKELEPLADQAADYININISPIAGFFIMSAFMYGNNLISFRMGLIDKA
jgi:hypothetical protein